jgi:hypothetical protein
MKTATVLSLTTLALTPLTLAGPLAYAICQAGCASVVMACYAAAGKLHTTLTSIGASPILEQQLFFITMLISWGLQVRHGARLWAQRRQRQWWDVIRRLELVRRLVWLLVLLRRCDCGLKDERLR